MGIYEAIADKLLQMPKVKLVFNLNNIEVLNQYKALRKIVRNKIISYHTQTQEYGILDKKNITIEDMTKIGLKKDALEQELTKLENIKNGNTVLLNILKETYEELISSFPETEPTPPNPGGGKKSRKYKSKKSKSRKYK